MFTDRAASFWKKSKYPYPDGVAACVATLAQVAVALYDGSDRTYPYLDTWIRDTFGLKVALQDDTIEKAQKCATSTTTA